MSEMLTAALEFAEKGWTVFPVKPRGKIPLTSNGLKDASSNPAAIREWWGQKWPSANIGIATGRVVVVDIDGPKGESSLAALETEFEPLPRTLQSRTGKGRHFFFAANGTTIRNSAGKLGEGIDIRGAGGYVIVPPSIHESGRRYEWVSGDAAALAKLPAWLIAKLQKAPHPKSNSNSQGEKIPSGQRNASLASMAGTMRRKGMSEAAILAALLQHNSEYCDPPLPESEVRAIAESVAKYPAAASQAEGDESPYAIERGRIVFLKHTNTGQVSVPLCNFAARITSEAVLDDGRETSREFHLGGSLANGKTLPGVRIPIGKFSAMNWPLESWGTGAVVAAGQNSRDRLREAIQLISGEVPTHHVYAHTGWRQLNDGSWIFLHAGGAVGTDDIEVELPAELQRYSLPHVAENPCEAMQLSLRLLEVAPLTVAAPLWAAMFRAPLANAHPLDFSLFPYGPTGLYKTTLTALYFCHFGDFSATTLPGAWSATANFLEHRSFVLKDLPFLIDDFVPSAALDGRELEAKAARLFRAQGNLSARGRMTSDIRERPTFSPRGLIVSTGEQLPRGHSVLARTFPVEFKAGGVDLRRLGELQSLAHRLPPAMSAYLAWLAPQMNSLPALLRETFAGTRDRARRSGWHPRIPEIIANLWLGAHSGLLFAEEIGALPQKRAEELRAQFWNAFLQLGEAHSRLLEGERPSRRFLEILATLISQQRAYLLPKGDTPASNRSEFLGWFDDEHLYLLPDGAFQTVAKFCREGGDHFPVNRERLLRDLKHEGFSVCDPERTLKNIRILDQPQRVLCICREAAEKLIGQAFSMSVASIASFSEGGET